MEAQRSIADNAPSLWIIEPRYSTVEFSIWNLFLFRVNGSFTDSTGTIAFDEIDLKQSTVEAEIDAASISTRIKRRDAHLRSADFLDAAQHPRIRFQSMSVERGRDRDAQRVAGTLTIKGRSREIVLDVMETDRSRSPRGDEIAYYTALAEIDRFDFGVDWGRGLIGRTIKITIQAQASKRR